MSLIIHDDGPSAPEATMSDYDEITISRRTVLDALHREIVVRRLDAEKYHAEITRLSARVAELDHTLGVIEGCAHLLRKAVESGDSKRQLVIRVEDIERYARARALTKGGE